MEEVTAGVYLVSISRSRYSAVYGGGHAKTALLHAAISAAAHQMCEMLMNVQFRSCRDERSELMQLSSSFNSRTQETFALVKKFTGFNKSFYRIPVNLLDSKFHRYACTKV